MKTTSSAHVVRTYADASRLLNELIKAECGNDPGAIDNYDIQVMPCTDAKTNNMDGKILMAWPRGSTPNATNIIAVVYDNTNATAEAERRGWL